MTTTQVSSSAPQPAQSCFTQVKQKATWAWDVSVQSVKNCAAAIKKCLQRIINAVCDFFSPKAFLDKVSCKLGARFYEPQLAALRQTNTTLTQTNTDLGNRLRESLNVASRADRRSLDLTVENIGLRRDVQEGIRLRDTLTARYNGLAQELEQLQAAPVVVQPVENQPVVVVQQPVQEPPAMVANQQPQEPPAVVALNLNNNRNVVADQVHPAVMDPVNVFQQPAPRNGIMNLFNIF